MKSKNEIVALDAYRIYRDRANGETWASCAARYGAKETDFRRAAWRGEVEANPDLKCEPTDENIVKLRAEGLRWEHIGLRVGLSSGKVETRWGLATGKIPSTSKAKLGRKWAEARTGEKPLKSPDAKLYLDGVKIARKAELVKGDGAQSARAIEIRDEVKTAKKEARKAK